MSVVYSFTSGKTQARFRRRSTHLPNLSDEFSTAKERRLNKFGMTVLVRCGRNAKLDRVCRIIRHWSGMWFIRRPSQVPNQCIHYAYIKFKIFWVTMRRTLNWGKWRVKKNALAPVALRIQNMLVYGARNSSVSLVLSSRMMKLSRAGKQALQTYIESNVSEKLWKSTKRSNVMIQMNPAKIEVHRSKKNCLLRKRK